MSLPLLVQAEAQDDLRKAYENLEQSRSGLGASFLAQVRETFGKIESTPELYGAVWQDVRAARLRRFRYLVYYVIFGDRVEVLAVLHGARDRSILTRRR